MIRSIENESRRRFLKGAAGLTLAVYLPWAVADGTTRSGKKGEFEPNAFLRVGEDNVVTVISKHLEMGQGAYTGLATLVAEELDADWTQVRVESAPAESRYNNSLLGIQGTGGSSSIANSWEQLRMAGATARAMLVSAAAWLWKVPAQEIEVVDGVLRHPASGKQATFGQLAKLASEQPVPTEVTLKDPSEFKLIGRQQLARKDSADKVNGRAIYTQDIHLPGMLTAVVAHPPRFGAKVKSFDAKPALAIPGVDHVVQIPSGVAVVAKDTWSAKKGRDALSIQWDESGAFKQSSEQIFQRYRELAKTPGTVVRNDGDVDAGLAGATRTLEAEYDFPFLAHSAMEPMNCVVALTKYGCETWHGAQMQSHVQTVLADLFGLEPEQVQVHTLYAGGSFGRRASKDADYVLENAQIVKAIGGRAPVKLVWMREDDMQAAHYRPMYHHRLTAGLDDQGQLVAWQHRLVGQSVFAGSPFSAFIKDGIDSTSVEGGSTLPYRIPNLRVDLHTPSDIPIPIQWWRVVGHSHNAFSTECFFDELAQMAGQDPVAWRLAMLEGHSRHIETLKLVAQKSDWDKPLAAGKQGERRGRGVALHEAFGSVVAQVAEVTVQSDGQFKLDRVVCSVECGIAVNPDVVRAQVEGSIGFALSAAMHEAITLTDGKIDQSNFHNNEPLRIYDMPKVEVHIVPSAKPPTGIGEPPVAPLAPALVNALAAATGKRIRRLPISDQLSA